MRNDDKTAKVIDEYQQYIKDYLGRSFDFNTWCQHQFGEPPPGITINPDIGFQIHINTMYEPTKD